MSLASSTPAAIKSLIYELREQVTICFEEGLHLQGLDFLTSLLTSGVPSNGTRYIPPPPLLSLLVTLSIHPNFTNRAKDASTASVSALAIRYLRYLNDLVNPKQSGIGEALSWPEVSLTRRGGLGRRRGVAEDVEGEGNGDFSGLRLPYARDRSVFWKTTDFWAIVGWAFRCSLLHPTRWKAYEAWLEYMIDTLERDFTAREDRDGGQVDSLIAKYAKGPEKRSRILRAVFADGSDRYAGDFPEVWRNETLPASMKNKDARQVKKIDVENDEFGDYLDVSTDEEHEEGAERPGIVVGDSDAMKITTEAPLKKVKPRLQQPESDHRTGILGGHVAAKQRMRLVGLLASLTNALPGHFGNPWTLYDDLLAYLKTLPIPTFLVIISPQYIQSFPPEAAIDLVKSVTNSLLQTGTKAIKGQDLDQEKLVESYLPYTANTNLYVDNAKLSICLETLMRLLDNHGMLYYDADLEMAVEKGIERRERKATTAKGKKGEANGEQDAELDGQGLRSSADRLRMLVHLKKFVAEKNPET